MKTLKVSIFLASVALLGSMAQASEQRCSGIETLRMPDGRIRNLKATPFLRVDARTLYMLGGGTETLFVVENKKGVYLGQNQSGSLVTKVEFLDKTTVKVSKIDGSDGSEISSSTYTNLVCE
jgi:hypothetical protein